VLEVLISPVAKALTLARAALAPQDSALRASLYSKAKDKGQNAPMSYARHILVTGNPTPD
jgi:hypothetical protein